MDMTNKQMDPARGYIASGEFNGNRIPQHIQNQIIKTYCDRHDMKFVLSRAEYWQMEVLTVNYGPHLKKDLST